MKQSRSQMQRWHVVLVLVGVAAASWLWQHCQHCSSINGPPSDTWWHIVGVLAAALIAAASTWLSSWWAARSTMKNARELQKHDLEHARKLQDRERRRDEESVASLLSADLHRRLTVLVELLLEPNEAARFEGLASMYTNSRVLEAALPKLGALGQQGSANLLDAFDGLALVSKRANNNQLVGLTEFTREIALNVGLVIITLKARYKLEAPKPLKNKGLDLEAVRLKELQQLGL